MAFYQNASYLTQDYGSEFNVVHEPGDTVPLSGIYRCTGCGESSTNVKHRSFPPQSHHVHPNSFTPIRWQLIVRSHWV